MLKTIRLKGEADEEKKLAGANILHCDVYKFF